MARFGIGSSTWLYSAPAGGPGFGTGMILLSASGVPIIGHGLEKSGRMFCCDHCAEQAGVTELRDRA